MELWMDGSSWSLVDRFGYCKGWDKDFMVSVNGREVGVIVFGDGRFGCIGCGGEKVRWGRLYMRMGIEGNVGGGCIVESGGIVKGCIWEGSSSNEYGGGGGCSYEKFGMLKEDIGLSVKSVGVGVRKEELVDLGMVIDGVNKGGVDYECGRKVRVYMSGDNGGVGDCGMIKKVYREVWERGGLSSWVEVKCGGLVDIRLEIEVRGKKCYKRKEMEGEVVNGL